ncbi:CoA transferase [Veronia pacifica]|nr:CoA transferase [Veronia pacifica]
MEGLSYNSIVIEDLPERYLTMREKEIRDRREKNQPMDVSYQALQEYLDPFYRTYKCKDGRYFYVVCPSHRNHARRCLNLVGIYDELIEEGLPEVDDLYLPLDEWSGETSIGVYPLPEKWAQRISEKMKREFVKKTSDEWGLLFGENGIPGAPHRTTKEWVNSEHCRDSGLIVDIQDPEFGEMRVPGPLVWFEHQADIAIKTKARQFVSYSDALTQFRLNTLAHSPADDVVLASDKQGWLSGVRILDLTNVIAGPHSAAFLARFGADVIKLDPTEPMYDPLIGVLFSIQSNIGKKSMLMDMLSPEGKHIFTKLVQSCDIVVINAPDRQVIPLGLDEVSLKTINPDVIFCRLDCFGGPLRAEKTNYIGYDDIIQANSGIMSRFGGPDTPEEHAHLGTLDVNCGFAAGLSMALALYHRERTGEAVRCRTSLSAIANLAQIKYAYDYADRAPFNEPSGRDSLGYHWLSRFYETQDGWLFLDAEDNQLDLLASLSDFSLLSRLPDNLRQEYIAERLRSVGTTYWVHLFDEVGIAVADPKSIEWLRKHYTRDADGRVGIHLGSYAFSRYQDHPSGHCITIVDHYAIRPENAAIISLPPTEAFGRSTKEVLSWLGIKDDEIEKLVVDNRVSLSWGREYLPS